MSLRERINKAPVERVRLTAIQVGARRRQKVGALGELKRSLERFGLIHPIILTTENELVAGERRYKAALGLDWSSIPARKLKLDASEVRELELEENLRRSDLDAYEASVTRTREIAALVRQMADEAGTGADSPKALKKLETAARKQLGIKPRTATQDRETIRDVKQFPTLESWPRRGIHRAAEAIRELPPEEWDRAERFAGTFPPRSGVAASEALENLIDWPAPLRQKIWTLASSKDADRRALAQTTALDIPPAPDRWYGAIKIARDQVREIAQGRKEKDKAQGWVRQALHNLNDAVKFLDAAYEELRREYEEKLGG